MIDIFHITFFKRFVCIFELYITNENDFKFHYVKFVNSDTQLSEIRCVSYGIPYPCKFSLTKQGRSLYMSNHLEELRKCWKKSFIFGGMNAELNTLQKVSSVAGKGIK